MSALVPTTKQVCPFCLTPVADQPQRCSSCGAPHHSECLVENDGCAVLGCTPAEEGTPDTVSHDLVPATPVPPGPGTPVPPDPGERPTLEVPATQHQRSSAPGIPSLPANRRNGPVIAGTLIGLLGGVLAAGGLAISFLHTDTELAEAREEAHDRGYDEGYFDGHDDGYSAGYGAGEVDGYNDALDYVRDQFSYYSYY